MKAPLVTVGLPVYNGEKFIRFALDSLARQEYDDFELVISDNASTDGTRDICLDYARRDHRIQYSRNDTNIGLGPNHNRVFELSRGKYFKWAASDDEYSTEMIKRLVEVFETVPASVSVIYSACEMIDESGCSLGIRSDHVETRATSAHRRLAHFLKGACVYNFVYGMIRSDILRKSRGHGSYPFADRVLFAELAILGEFLEIAEPLFRLRSHSGRSFQANPDRRSLRAFFDPRNRERSSILSLEEYAQWQLVRSVCRLRLDLKDRCMCLGVALTLPYWLRFRNYAGLQKQKIRVALHRMVGSQES